MACQLKKHYRTAERHVLRSLRESVVRPASLLLTGIFLLANLVFAYAEVHGNDQPPQSSSSSFCSLDSHYDLNSATVEGREFNGGREKVESFSHSKILFENSHRHGEETPFLASVDYRLILVNTVLRSSALCNAPFSPRPPPFFSTQG